MNGRRLSDGCSQENILGNRGGSRKIIRNRKFPSIGTNICQLVRPSSIVHPRPLSIPNVKIDKSLSVSLLILFSFASSTNRSDDLVSLSNNPFSNSN